MVNAWRLFRLTDAEPCAACKGTAQQETVDGETEVFQVGVSRHASCKMLFNLHSTMRKHSMHRVNELSGFPEQ